MKKTIVASIALILVLSLSSMVTGQNTNLPRAEAILCSGDNPTINKEPKGDLYYQLLVTILYPYVQKAIDNFYNEYMTYLPGEAPYGYEFIEIEKTPELNYSFTVVLEVQPYVGPHLSVGRDRITFSIDLDGVKLKKFEHLESYELPPNYQTIIKKKLPK